VWLRDPGVRARSTPLTRERIVEAAVALLDGHGIEGLTMRRLAGALDVTPTALYWHVRTKEDVLDLAVDRIFGAAPVPPVTADWREDVRALARAWRTAMLEHPWAPGLIGRPVLGPNVLARTEFLQSALVRGGLSDLGLAVTTRLLANYVIGAALTESAWRRSPGAGPAPARAHITADPAAYPTLTASGHLDAERWDDESLFDRGLDAILAGACGGAVEVRGR